MRIFYLKTFLAICCLITVGKVSAEPFSQPFYDNNDECFCYSSPACWQGIYISGQLGGGWHKQHAKFRNANFFNSNEIEVLGSNFNFKSERFVGGGGIGLNYQMDCFVVGLEGGALSINHRKSITSPFFPTTDRFSSHLHWIGYTKLRIGYAYNCFLAFITGGWAGGNIHLRLVDNQLNVAAQSKKWTNGWTVGAGADYKITDCFSLGLAYDYISLQYRNRTLSCPTCGSGPGLGTPRVNNHHQAHTLILRINYLFDLSNLF